jgi:protein-S-isoprenylcysteine O-methyltransferase Ste14
VDTGRGGELAGAQDDERWAQAQSVLDQQPTREADQRLRRSRRLVWTGIAGVLMVGVAVGVLVSVLVSGSGGNADDLDPPVGQVVSGMVVQGVGALVEIVGIVVMWRAGMFRKDRWSIPGAVLTRTQRTTLLRQVQGRVPMDPRRLPLARDVARRLVVQRAQLLLLVGLLLLQLGQAIASPSLWRSVLAGALVVLYAVLLGQVERNARRAGRFLTEHPRPAEAG